MRLGQESKLHSYILWRAVYSLALLPFAVAGLLLHLPIFLLGRLSNRITRDAEEKSTSKLLVIAVAAPLQYVLLLGALYLWFGLAVLGYALLVGPVVGFFLITYVSQERQTLKSLLQLIWLFLLLKNSEKVLRKLIGQREELRVQLDAVAKEWLRQTSAPSILEHANVRACVCVSLLPC